VQSEPQLHCARLKQAAVMDDRGRQSGVGGGQGRMPSLMTGDNRLLERQGQRVAEAWCAILYRGGLHLDAWLMVMRWQETG